MEKITDMKQRLGDILFAVSWRDLSRTYFDKSVSWLYHKMDGIDGNGGTGGFTPHEAEQMKGALCDLVRIKGDAKEIGKLPSRLSAAFLFF